MKPAPLFPRRVGDKGISEEEFMQQIMELALLCGWEPVHFRTGRTKGGRWAVQVQGSGKGWPDLVIFHEQRRIQIAAELKVGNALPSPAQRKWLRVFAAVGAKSFCWYPKDWPEIERLLMGV